MDYHHSTHYCSLCDRKFKHRKKTFIVTTEQFMDMEDIAINALQQPVEDFLEENMH